MSKLRPTAIGWLVGALSRLRHPVLFAIVALLFAVDLVLPDAIPFVDELLLGLGAAALASWKKRRADEAERPEDPHAGGGRDA